MRRKAMSVSQSISEFQAWKIEQILFVFILVGLAPQVSKKPGILELCHVMNEDLLLDILGRMPF